MGHFKTIRHIYDEIDEALKMEKEIKALYIKEGVYSDHFMSTTHDNRYIITFKLNASTDMH